MSCLSKCELATHLFLEVRVFGGAGGDESRLVADYHHQDWQKANAEQEIQIGVALLLDVAQVREVLLRRVAQENPFQWIFFCKKYESLLKINIFCIKIK